MSETVQLVGCAVLGAMAAGAYFSGLWWTVNRITQAQHLLGIYLGSFLVRLGVLGGGVYFLLQFGLQYLVAAFIGFLVVRFVMTAKLGAPAIANPASARKMRK